MAGQISLIVLAVTIAVNIVVAIAFHFLAPPRMPEPPEIFAEQAAEAVAVLNAVPSPERRAVAAAMPGVSLAGCDGVAAGSSPQDGEEARLDGLLNHALGPVPYALTIEHAGPRAPVPIVIVGLAGGGCVRIDAETGREPPPRPPGFPMPFGLPPLALILISAAALISALSIWATRRVTRPLARLADAADRLGHEGSGAHDSPVPPLTLTGSSEVRRAAQAFNAMQERLAQFVETRTRMLAAISHDYRTILTRLRLRAEGIDESDLRKRLMRDFDLMEAMVDSTLVFARDANREEAIDWLDLPSLLESLCDGLGDLGHEVTLAAPARHRIRCRPLAMERAIGNVIGNAVKYGRHVAVALEAAPERTVIRIEDDGPGIPEAEMTRVFEPFYRVDAARSMDAKGVGLGLSIADTILRDHHGRIELANRIPHGLTATIEFPAL